MKIKTKVRGGLVFGSVGGIGGIGIIGTRGCG